MNLPTPDEIERYRARVRAVVAEHRPPGEARAGCRSPDTHEEEAFLRRWYRVLYETGLAGGGWPPEWGGDPDFHPLFEMIVTEELIRARAPRLLGQVQLATHLLLSFGTDEQKARYLPRIRRAEDIWCQLFSEPDAGSDLAGIRSRATLLPTGSFRLNGQKTWTTDGHWADMGVALLRTGQGATRHQTLTVFLVPMHAPGVTVRPLVNIAGLHEFNEVFLDDVILPAGSVLGRVGEGWRIAMSGLDVERFILGSYVELLQLLMDDLADAARHVLVAGERAIDRRDIRRDIAEMAADTEAASAFLREYVDRIVSGEEEEGDGAIAKMLYSEAYNRIARYGSTLVTGNDARHPVAQRAARRLLDAWFFSRAITIAGGSSEVMRNIVARRRLRLPSA